MKDTIFETALREAKASIAATEPKLAELEAKYAEQLHGMAEYRLANATADAARGGLPQPRRNPAGPGHLRLPADAARERVALQRTLEKARKDVATYSAYLAYGRWR